jgi:pantoate--beta-alanine ligase
MVLERTPMTILRTIAELRAALQVRAARVGFVPTLGALHGGHVSLIRAARARCATVVTSVFVNARQFNDAADLAAYPRQEARDVEIAREAGADLFFAPAADEIYPPGYATAVDVAGAALGYEGALRPGHFAGVATICLKLFNIVRADEAFFGQKDAQQVAVIRQVVRDLDLTIEIRVEPTVRDADGLALSSRNAQLSADERSRARAIPQALRDAVAAHRRGADPVAAAKSALAGLTVDYVAIARFDGQPTLVVAARMGTTRLIDNVPLEAPELAGL